MYILHISFECYPYAKVGGMADVVGALPKYLKDVGAEAAVIMPHYDKDWQAFGEMEIVYENQFYLDWENVRFGIIEHTDIERFRLFSVSIPGKFDRPNIYSYPDDAQRSLAFQRAVLTWVAASEIKPDIIHCHDHHTGLTPFMMYHSLGYENLREIPSFFTIHNAAYQGAMSWNMMRLLPQFFADRSGLLEWNDAINPLASAIKCTWHFNTVSNGYMEELFQFAHGLESLIRMEGAKASGILNGIDMAVWDPGTDPLLPVHLKRSIDVFKRKNKAHFCEKVRLDPEKPLYLFIGRLAYEKGADMLPSIIGDFLSQHDDVQFAVLGTGEGHIEANLRQLEHFFPDRMRSFIMYSEELAHRLYAASDFLLMPSRVEPCGLNQMYSMRYGGIPIVRRTGGLSDTVEPLSDTGGNGYVFDELNVHEVRALLKASRNLYQHPDLMSTIRKRNMAKDFSWEHSAKQYLDIYASLTS